MSSATTATSMIDFDWRLGVSGRVCWFEQRLVRMPGERRLALRWEPRTGQLRATLVKARRARPLTARSQQPQYQPPTSGPEEPQRKPVWEQMAIERVSNPWAEAVDEAKRRVQDSMTNGLRSRALRKQRPATFADLVAELRRRGPA